MRRTAATVLVAALVTATPITPTPAATARPAPADSAPTTSALRTLVRTPPWTSRVVSAAGVRQWLTCSGKGPVTVVVIAGLHATHTMWSKVLPSFARTTRTCIYDRPGLGLSPARRPHATVDAGKHAYELWALLVKARVPTPLIIVGHSYGGLIARAFVARYRSHVAGLMLVEGVAPYDRLSHYWHEGGDTVDTWASSRAAARMRLGSLPLVVESAQDPDRSYWGGPAYGGSPSDITDWKAHQRAAASLSTNSTFVIVRHSAHVIEHDQPAAVIAGVRLIVSAVVHRHRLPRCALGAYGSQPLCA